MESTQKTEPIDVKTECLEMYQKLYRWHTEEIKKLEPKLAETKEGDKKKRVEIVQKRLIVERRRIRKIYPEIFDEDTYDSKF